jgi:hypothetical protein
MVLSFGLDSTTIAFIAERKVEVGTHKTYPITCSDLLLGLRDTDTLLLDWSYTALLDTHYLNLYDNIL